MTDLLQYLVLILGGASMALGAYLVYAFRKANTKLGLAVALLLATALVADATQFSFSIFSAFDLWKYIPQWATASARIVAFGLLLWAELHMLKTINPKTDARISK